MKKRMVNVVLALLLVSAFFACDPGGDDGGGGGGTTIVYPAVIDTSPAINASNVAPNGNISATFSKDMDETTITSGGFVLLDGVTPVNGTCSYNAVTKTATINPDSDLTYSHSYTAVIYATVTDTEGNALQSEVSWDFTTSDTPDLIDPVIDTSSRTPAPNSTGISNITNISVSFIEANEIDMNTVDSSSFNVSDGISTVSGSYTYNSSTNTITFDPTNSLNDETTYTVSINTDITDLAGNNLTAGTVWTFSTPAVPPTVSSTTPANDATNVALNSNIEIVFSEAMNATTINNTNIQVNGGAVTGVVSYASGINTATFNPDSDFSFLTAYTVTVSTGVQDANGNSMTAEYTFDFTSVTDTINPAISSVTVSDGSTDIAVDSTIQVTFSKAIDDSTVDSSSFIVTNELGNTVAGAYSYNSGTFTVTFTPTLDMIGNLEYNYELTTDIEDNYGNSLSVGADYDFETDESTTAWVFAIYMAGDNSLSDAVSGDIAEMMASNLNGRDIRVIVLADQDGANNTRLYEVFGGYQKRLASTELGLSATLSTDELNTGSPVTLENFIDFVNNEYPSNNFSVVLWNHGGGWRSTDVGKLKELSTPETVIKQKDKKTDELFKSICQDDTSAGVTIGNNDIQTVLSGKGVNMVCMDACIMGMLETAYELRKDVTEIDTLVFSQNNEPAAGYPYTTIFNDLIATSDKTSSNFAQLIVNDFVASYSSSSEVTQSAINLDLIDEVVSNMETFITYLGTQSDSDIDNARAACEQYSVQWFVDLEDFVSEFSDASATALNTAISNAVIHANSRSGKPNASGLSIYFPTTFGMLDYDDTTDNDGTANENSIDFLDDSSWDNYLFNNDIGLTLDNYEGGDNNAIGGLFASNSDFMFGYCVSPYDFDVYTFEVTATGTFTISLTNVPATADLQIEFYYYVSGGDDIHIGTIDSFGLGGSESLNYTYSVTGIYYAVVTAYDNDPDFGTLDLVNPYLIQFGGLATY